MKKLFGVMVMVCFVLSLSGLSFAQSPSTTAQEKASDNASFNRKDAKPAVQPDAAKMKAEKEKAVKETGEKGKTAKETGEQGKAVKETAEKGKAAKGTAEKEKATLEKAGQAKGKASQEKIKLNPEDVKKQ